MSYHKDLRIHKLEKEKWDCIRDNKKLKEKIEELEDWINTYKRVIKQNKGVIKILKEDRTRLELKYIKIQKEIRQSKGYCTCSTCLTK